MKAGQRGFHTQVLFQLDYEEVFFKEGGRGGAFLRALTGGIRNFIFAFPEG